MSKCNWCGEHTYDPLSFDNYEEEFCSMRCFDQFLTRGYKPTKRSGCFVATACLGDYNHPVVLDLRRFRDEFLKRKTWGRQFITWYYAKGPIFAKKIVKSTTIKRAVYILLIKPLHLTTSAYFWFEERRKKI